MFLHCKVFAKYWSKTFGHIFFCVAENWDSRDNNLQKQAHLLKAAELKKRGITRYDAEILLSQGLKLPEPKVVLGRKLPASIHRHHTVKVKENDEISLTDRSPAKSTRSAISYGKCAAKQALNFSRRRNIKSTTSRVSKKATSQNSPSQSKVKCEQGESVDIEQLPIVSQNVKETPSDSLHIESPTASIKGTAGSKPCVGPAGKLVDPPARVSPRTRSKQNGMDNSLLGILTSSVQTNQETKAPSGSTPANPAMCMTQNLVCKSETATSIAPSLVKLQGETEVLSEHCDSIAKPEDRLLETGAMETSHQSYVLDLSCPQSSQSPSHPQSVHKQDSTAETNCDCLTSPKIKPNNKRKFKDVIYASTLHHDSNLKVPKITIRMTREVENEEINSVVNDMMKDEPKKNDLFLSMDDTDSQGWESSHSRSPHKKKKKSKKDIRHSKSGVIKLEDNDDDNMIHIKPQNLYSSVQCNNNNNNSIDSDTPPCVKRLRLKFGGNSIAITLPSVQDQI